MKTIIKSYLMVLLCTISIPASMAQKKEKKTETVEFSVTGVCDMCKKRIQNAALIKGVKSAEWNSESQTLKVIFRSDKVSEDAIHKAVAEAGHDTKKIKATEEAYKKLPGCCAYRNDIKVH